MTNVWSSWGRRLVALPGVSAITGLGFGTAALKNTGTSGDAVPLLNTANTWSGAQTITDGNSALPQLIVQSTNADNLPGPMIQLDRNSASPAASDVMGYVQYAGRSSTGVQREFGGLRILAVSVTNGAESGSFDFITINGGSAGVRMRCQAGIQVGIPTGTDQGSGTINVASGYYVNGVQISTPGSPVTKTADFTVAATEQYLINNKSGSACVVTLPTASAFPGRKLQFKNHQAQQLNSASSNVVALGGGAAGTAILTANAGRWAKLVSDGSNWQIMAGVV